jgi:hypothetical protein
MNSIPEANGVFSKSIKLNTVSWSVLFTNLTTLSIVLVKALSNGMFLYWLKVDAASRNAFNSTAFKGSLSAE